MLIFEVKCQIDRNAQSLDYLFKESWEPQEEERQHCVGVSGAVFVEPRNIADRLTPEVNKDKYKYQAPDKSEHLIDDQLSQLWPLNHVLL